jgi:phosphate transport system substrate-binding protein
VFSKVKPRLLGLIFIFLTISSLKRFDGAAAIDAKPAPLMVAGSGTCIPVVAKLAATFNLQTAVPVTVPASVGSSGAIKALKEGSLSLGLTSRPLKEAEKNAGLTEIPFAKVGIVFGVHPGVPDTNLSSADLVNIVKGVKTKWRNGRTIIVFNREEGDSTIELLKKEVNGFTAAYQASRDEKKWIICFTDQEEAQAIARTKNSFGFSDTGTIYAANIKIKALNFNRIAPTLGNLRSAQYPFAKTLYFIYKGKLIPAEAQAFVNFVQSPPGQKILAENGALALEE